MSKEDRFNAVIDHLMSIGKVLLRPNLINVPQMLKSGTKTVFFIHST